MNYFISQLAMYPLKSAAGIALNQMTLDQRGPVFDRRWMVVDNNNKFVTQRKHAAMCSIEVSLDQNQNQNQNQNQIQEIEQEKEQWTMTMSAPNRPTFTVTADTTLNKAVVIEVVVWQDTVKALDCGDQAAVWLSDYLKSECRLVYMPNQSKRLVDPKYAKQQQVGFADGFPLLIASEASLAAFNQALSTHGSNVNINMQRFRPNLVVNGCEPYAEDRWRKIKIGEITFSLVKPCSRCIIPAIDPATGSKQMSIIEVLNKTRRCNQKTYFGQNALHDRNGVIELGDSVTVLE